MNIIDKIMNALSLYDEEEIIEEEVEQKPAKTEQEPAKPKKRFFGSKEPALRYRQRSLSVNANPF